MLIRTEMISAKRNRYVIAHKYNHFSRKLETLAVIRLSFFYRRRLPWKALGSLLPYPELIARYRQAITDFAASDKPRLP